MAKSIRLLLALLCIALLFLSPSLSASADFSPEIAEAAESAVIADATSPCFGDAVFALR